VIITKSPVGEVSEFSALRAFFFFNLKNKAMKETALQQKNIAASRKHSSTKNLPTNILVHVSMYPWAAHKQKSTTK